MKIIKNFLEKKDYKNIKETIFSDGFPWYFYEESVTNIPVPQFVHMMFWQQKLFSNNYSLLVPILNKLNPLALYKIKVNLNYKTETVIETGEHIDLDNKNFLSAVFFLNNCDGYCRIKDKKVYSEDNKIVIFNSNEKHTGTTTSNSSRRIVINIIYLPYES